MRKIGFLLRDTQQVQQECRQGEPLTQTNYDSKRSKIERKRREPREKHLKYSTVTQGE